MPAKSSSNVRGKGKIQSELLVSGAWLGRSGIPMIGGRREGSDALGGRSSTSSSTFSIFSLGGGPLSLSVFLCDLVGSFSTFSFLISGSSTFESLCLLLSRSLPLSECLGGSERSEWSRDRDRDRERERCLWLRCR